MSGSVNKLLVLPQVTAPGLPSVGLFIHLHTFRSSQSGVTSQLIFEPQPFLLRFLPNYYYDNFNGMSYI